MHTHSTNKPMSATKLIATIFWDRATVLMLDFMQQGTTVTSSVMQNTIKLHRAILNNRCGTLPSSIVLLHYNAHPHTAAYTRVLLEHFNWELFDHPPYSPDLTLSNYHLYLKSWLGSKHFNNNEELSEGVKMWLTSQGADFFYVGIQKLVPQYDNCLNSGSDYTEKLVITNCSPLKVNRCSSRICHLSLHG
jgi:histone-lysine N-methyltransferase SETMAR